MKTLKTLLLILIVLLLLCSCNTEEVHPVEIPNVGYDGGGDDDDEPIIQGDTTQTN